MLKNLFVSKKEAVEKFKCTHHATVFGFISVWMHEPGGERLFFIAKFYPLQYVANALSWLFTQTCDVIFAVVPMEEGVGFRFPLTKGDPI